jgi:hypothetical protein
MSFEPVTRWVLRCDGTTTYGQCDQRAMTCHPDDDPNDPASWYPALYDKTYLDDRDRTYLHWAHWLVLPDGRVLCPRHIAALEHLAWAALDGLPFDDLRDQPDPSDHGREWPGDTGCAA